MSDVKLEMDKNGKGAFLLIEGHEKIGEMTIGVSGNTLEAYHTGVEPRFEGKGFAKKLLSAMVDYARANNLKVNPSCSYVNAEFKRNPQEYKDVLSEQAD